MRWLGVVIFGSTFAL
jgi:ubiquitin-protein ligase